MARTWDTGGPGGRPALSQGVERSG